MNEHEELLTLVFQALGEASMCWQYVEKAGIFQSDEAVEIGTRLVHGIEAHYANRANKEEARHD